MFKYIVSQQRRRNWDDNKALRWLGEKAYFLFDIELGGS